MRKNLFIHLKKDFYIIATTMQFLKFTYCLQKIILFLNKVIVIKQRSIFFTETLINDMHE